MSVFSAARAISRILLLAPLLAVLLSAGAAGSGCGNEATAARTVAWEQGGEPSSSPLLAAAGFQRLAYPATIPARQLRVTILMYHHVGTQPPGADAVRRDLTVDPATFAKQMDYLARAGFTPITQARLFRALLYGEPLPDKPVLLTFDDGYEDCYQQAVPVLLQHGFPATFYVLAGKVGSPGYMNWSQVLDLDSRGMDIGSHGVSHRDLTVIGPDAAREELQGSQAALTLRLGHPVYWFCYPSGKYDPGILAMTGQRGYLLAVTTTPGKVLDSRLSLALPRCRIHADTDMDDFVDILNRAD